ncbi:eukaryotic translation initiation factor 5-like [Cryptomeria japonica]|uniref:eukaryotic translation initiation factor 5-like n=1 Tax=Cryptomeria japonica TaxID=3369 RepID=UPI0027D9F52C|nr:eukaryotic translation initiation factor 5-like [Cryptomeria japonica]
MGTEKGKDKDMASGSGRKTFGKGFKGNRKKVQEKDNWFEEDDEDDDGIETESEMSPHRLRRKLSAVQLSLISVQKRRLIEILKSKQEASSKKINILEVVRTGSSLPNNLKELTKAINNVKAITEAYGSKFKVVEAMFNELEKRVYSHEETLKKIREQSHKILKASVDNFIVLISKLKQIQLEKNTIDIYEDKDLIPEGMVARHGKRTWANMRKMAQQAKELDDLKCDVATMVQLEKEVVELLKNFS